MVLSRSLLEQPLLLPLQNGGYPQHSLTSHTASIRTSLQKTLWLLHVLQPLSLIQVDIWDPNFSRSTATNVSQVPLTQQDLHFLPPPYSLHFSPPPHTQPCLSSCVHWKTKIFKVRRWHIQSHMKMPPPFCFPQMCAALCWVPGIHGKQDKAAPRSSQSSCFQSASNDSTCADAHPSPPFHSSHDHPARCTTITARTCKNVSPNLPSLPQTSTHPSRSCPLS